MYSEWESLDVPAGKPQVKAQLKEMPPGPYVICDQFEYSSFEGMTDLKVLSEHRERLSNFIPDRSLGKVALYFDHNRRLQKCFYHFDTSD